MRLLVVEDELRLATLLRKGLTEEGHAVDLAGSGEDGLDWVSVGEYDAIVLDVTRLPTGCKVWTLAPMTTW